MKNSIKYFIISVINSTSAQDDYVAYQCRVVDDEYNEIFHDILNYEDKNIFIKIVSSDKDALLYKNHSNENLKKLAFFKIDNYQKQSILDATL